jgi:2,5-diamino-6-(ribosylamino)-4(3H)-pyrimidinone 5'-phosphate reductase
MTAPAERPFVYVNMAMTVDGKITSATREYPGFTSPVDRVRMDRLRATADALMVGAGTVRADNPAWHVRTKEVRERRLAEGRAGGPHRVLVSASARLRGDSRFFDGSHGGRGILVTTRRATAEHLAAFEGRAEVLLLGEERVDLRAALKALRERGVARLLVEGGAELNWALLEHDLVDELYVTIAPTLLGGSAAPTLLEGHGWPMVARRRLRLLELEREGDEIFLRYAVGP